MSTCIFCDIIDKKIPAHIVFEDEHIIAFHDIHPKARIHVLVVPKKHIESLATLKEEDVKLIGHLTSQLSQVAKLEGLYNGFRTVVNTGPAGGQEVYHLHYHILAEK